MEEGCLRPRYRGRFEAFSVGTEISTVSPYVFRVMKEIGLDITGQRSKDLKERDRVMGDVAVIVIDTAKSACPFFPGQKNRFMQVSGIRKNLREEKRRSFLGSGRSGTRYQYGSNGLLRGVFQMREKFIAS
jgi:protein-tyrosine-phosphatase